LARPREFDREEVLGKALEIFWTKGYEATSLNDLIGSMELSKSSFYQTFGSKNEVFLASIRHYIKTMTAQIASLAQLELPARSLISSLFNRAVIRITEEGGQRGCFLNNCAVEVALKDERAAKIINSGFELMEETFFLLVQRGQLEGEIEKTKNARALARYLNSSLNGLFVIAKANPNSTSLADVVCISLTALD
jgi:TetR/AcrR family transcriptional repressor of nem operon